MPVVRHAFARLPLACAADLDLELVNFCIGFLSVGDSRLGGRAGHSRWHTPSVHPHSNARGFHSRSWLGSFS